MDKSKVPITERALTQRINRALKKDNQKLCKPRTEGELGGLYIINLLNNSIEASNCDLEKLGLECGALKPYERLVVE